MRARGFVCALLAVIFCTPFISFSAGLQDSILDRIKADHEQIEKAPHGRRVRTTSAEISSAEPQAIDVNHYKLQLQLTPNERGTDGEFSGSVTITGQFLGAVNSISIDAQP